jgi:DNA mismatch repair protein MLH1
VGTTIVVQDLFHNVPHRQSAYSKKEGEEYAKILSVVQQYAIHYPNVGFVCQRQRTTGKGGASGGGVVVDCNTSQIPAVKALLQSRNAAMAESKDHANQPEIMEATKQILSHVLGANLREHLLQFHCSSLSSDTSAAWTAATSSSSQYKLQYEAQVYFTTPDYALRQQKQQQQGRFILFLNHRLVDLPPLKRAMEDAYVHFTVGGTIGKSNNTAGGNTARPVLVVNLTVPGAQVDVNVHPSKRQVALMYQEDVINAITGELRKQLEDRGQSFASQSVCNPYAKTKTTAKRKEPPRDDDANNNHDKKKANDNECATAAPSTTSQSETSGISSRNSNDNAKKQKVVPSKLIRTNRATPAGAIEPFLVQTQTTPSQKSTSSAQSSTPSTQSGDMLVTPKRQHLSDCPLSRSSPSPGSAIDMSQPGAFVDAMRCTCPPEAARQTVLVKQPVVRPKRVKPTHCEYVSIKTLRKRLLKQQCAETTAQMRKAFFMGVISNQRSLVQCGEELVLINHMEMAKELFYQLALARFGGGAAMAHLGELGGNGGIHVQTAIEQALQFEDNLILSEDGGSRHEKLSQPKSCGLLDVNETNHKMALQATSVLLEKADMLEEYFSIRIECTDPDSEIEDVDNTVDAVLTGLPVLLEGHSPQPHGLPIFLLRLATQVDWEEERPCFYGICKELGDFYAMSPNESDALNAFVRHNLFPALSYLLIPPKSFPANGYFTSMTKLSTLYKVFERC